MSPLSSFEAAEFNAVAASPYSSLKCVPAITNDTRLISTSSPRRRSSVTFSPEVTVRLHLHINEIHKKDVRATWYNPRELHLIRACARCEAKYQRLGLLAPSHFHGSSCTRGLELRSSSVLGPLRMKNMIAARQAVFEVQASSSSFSCSFDAEYLAQVYRFYSRPCQKAARDLALQDEKDANNILS
jgi:hypothetical protein